jgi:hypothetical protein
MMKSETDLHVSLLHLAFALLASFAEDFVPVSEPDRLVEHLFEVHESVLIAKIMSPMYALIRKFEADLAASQILSPFWDPRGSPS